MWFPMFSTPLSFKCYKEPSWFPFQILNPLSEIKSFLEQNRIFLDGSIWFPVFSVPLCYHVI